ncbi:hypothetical protein [Actinomadura violacea]|uniref:Uncharacterized protein n=1 Tax=Actinomadura violacea TaxID=2819934 RepID=A0ABS3S8B8_9ACTN|nr:hypothetical protein [Actinomadura violacea]MBO2464484.1 hypothetical protein [Actinomadura violacea]
MADHSAVIDGEILVPVSAALDIAHGAYEQAMIQQGLLPDAVKVIRAMAEQNIQELNNEE